MHPYIPHTEEEIKEMLNFLNISNIEELFSDLPTKFERDLNIPGPLSEEELREHFRELTSRNINLKEYAIFRGAGIYNHYIPSVINQLLHLRNFLTAYTPYQAELSQGTLQALFEYQSMIVELTGMEVANSSMYDGASALAEAVLMASRLTKRYKTLIARNIHPEYIETVRTYIEPQGLEMEFVKYDKKTGQLDLQDLKNKLDDKVASVVIGYPNFFGIIENIKIIKENIPEKVKLIVSTYPIALGMLEAPGKLGADIVTGEGQSLGIYPSFGGPAFGFFASKMEYIRQMPGRIIGETLDLEGKRGFVMVLQAREQHIRRAKATSNICSNQAFAAVMGMVYLALMGKRGIKEVAYQNYHKSHYLAKKMVETEKFEPVFSGPFFNEFVLKSNFDLKEFNKKLFEEKFIGPIELERFYPEYKNHALFCATELNSKEEIDYLATKVGEII